MADNYKALALNTPHGCKLSMVFKFNNPHRISEFLSKLDIPHLFHNVAYWQDARFKFLVHGVDHQNFFNSREIDVPLDLLHFELKSVTHNILQAFNILCAYGFVEEPYIGQLEINFPNAI